MKIKFTSIILAFLIVVSNLVAYAEEEQKYCGYTVPYDVAVNGQYLYMTPPQRTYDGVLYVSIRAFSDILGASLYWDKEENKITILRYDNTVVIKPEEGTISVNGYTSNIALKNLDNFWYAPVDVLTPALGLSGEWDNQYTTYRISGEAYIAPGYEKKYFNDSNLTWMARLIQAECNYEPFTGKIGVANVIFNRMKNPTFPDTAEEVIFDTRYGVQFYRRGAKMSYANPTRENIMAAKIALNGTDVTYGCLYYSNKMVAANTWMGRNRPYGTTIGNHAFYR